MTWLALNLASSEFAEPPEPPAVCGLVYRGARHVLSGPPESAKTILSLILALEHTRATGGRWVHVDFEMGPTSTRRMLTDLGATSDELKRCLYFEPEHPPELEDLEYITGEAATFAIIDALAGAFDVSSLDDNQRRDVERFGAVWVRPLWERGVTTLLLDHVTKNGETRGKYAIGSERKIGQADVHLGLEAVTSLSRGSDGLFRIVTHKDRPGFLTRPHAAELDLHSDPDTHAITWRFKQAEATDADRDSWRPTVLMDRAAGYLRDQTGPCTRNDIAAAISGKRKYALDAINYLIADGVAEEVDGPGRGKLVQIRRTRLAAAA